MVAEATASPIFTGTATVAQVWTSMPMFPTPSSLVGALPRCLFMEAASYSESGQDLMSSALAPTHAILGKPPAAIPELLAPYPAARGFEITGERPTVIQGVEPRAIVAFPAEGGGYRNLSKVTEHAPRTGDESLLSRSFVFRPPVGEADGEPPSQLMTVWALLFTLSQLTRYYPAAWVGALDPDESEIAVALEHGLEVALAVVPQLLSSGLSAPILRLADELLQRGEAEPQQ